MVIKQQKKGRGGERTEGRNRERREKKKKKKAGIGVGVCFRGIFRGRDGLPNTLLTLDSFSVGFLKDLLLIQAFLGLSVFVGSEEE